MGGRIARASGRRETLTIVESAPARYTRRTKLTRIVITPDKKNDEVRARLSDIDALLATVPRPERIRELIIDYDSKLTKLPDLTRFANLRELYVGARRIRDHAPLGDLSSLRELCVVAYKRRDLRALRDLKLDEFRAIRGDLRRFDMSVRFAFLQVCTKLVEFEPVRIESLCLDGCHSVDLSTLANIRQLTELDLLGLRVRDFTLDFVARIPTLRSLVLTGTGFGRADYSAIASAPSLTRLFVAANDATIADVATTHPRLTITNGDVCYHAGRLQADCGAYYRTEGQEPP